MIISPDKFLTVDGIYRWNGYRASQAWTFAEQLFRYTASITTCPIFLTCGLPGSGKSTWAATKEVDSLIFDATLTKAIDRKKVLSWTTRPISCAFFNTSLEICLARNAQRPPDRRISEEIIQRMAAQLTATPPSLEEGFQKIICFPP